MQREDSIEIGWFNVGTMYDGGCWPGQEAEGMAAVRSGDGPDDTDMTIAYVVDPDDAPVIASARDLLAALTRLLEIAEDQTGVRADTDEGEMAAAQRDARAAIRKAKGA